MTPEGEAETSLLCTDPVESVVSSCMCNHTCDVPCIKAPVAFIRRIDMYYITPADVPHPVM